MSLFSRKSKFVLSDGTIKNSYGFKIPTSGIETTRFEANPVMLNGHLNDTASVIGAWDNMKKDLKTNRLLAEPVFDKDDETAKKIAGKVEAGFIKGASIGISFNRDDLKKIGDELVLTRCELLEASIVAIPSNANALKLYDSEGKALHYEEVTALCMSAANNNTTNFKTETMEKQMQLSLTALAVLGFEASQVEKLQASDINEAVLGLHKEREQLKAKVEAYETKEKQAQAAEKARLEARNAKLVDDAIKAGRITADERSHYLKMADFDFAMAEKALGNVAGKVSLGAGLNPITGKEMTIDEFEKLDTDAQLKWKNENPEGYKKMVE